MPDKNFWEQRYLDNQTGWDTGAITTPLKEYFDQLKSKSSKILIPGAGNGYEAEYLFNSGFNNVFVLDISEIPLKNLKERVPDFPASHLLNNDFFNLQGSYDFIIEQTFFCALDPELRPAYAKKVADLLKPGGKLVGLLFNDELNKDNPPFGGSKDEYEEYFRPYFNFKTFETAYNSIPPRAERELFINLIRK